jgi:hypothetical protein
MDSYLFEGYKVLYRVCFSIVHSFAKKAKAKNSPIGKSIKDSGLQNAFRDFCKQMPVQYHEIGDTFLAYRRLLGNEIKVFFGYV